MRIAVLLCTAFWQSLVNAQSYLEVTDASAFYEEFRKLVLAGNREEVAKLLSYPLPAGGIKIESKTAFINNYDLIIQGPILDLINCSSGADVEQMGWRGYMVSNWGIWMDGKYFGEIKPIEESQSYLDDVKAMADDKDHWYIRIQAIFPEGASCEDLP